MKLSVLNIEISGKSRTGSPDLIDFCLAVSAFRAGVTFLIHCLIFFSSEIAKNIKGQFYSLNIIANRPRQCPSLVVLHL
jgi:hypothetical protein